MSKVNKGSCMCGEIQFEFSDTNCSFNLCHCQMCQKFSGSAFGAFFRAKKETFKFIKGEDLEKIYPSSDWASRAFCSNCGSSIRYIYHEKPENVYLSAGLLDGKTELKPVRHIFTKDKCQWFDITDNIPQVEKF